VAYRVAHILVADDDDLLGELLRFKLEGAGHRVTIIGDGQSALDAALSGAYDLMVLDAMMPVLSGPEVLRALVQQGSRLPVVMLTARKGQDDVLDALSAGARDYLTKPFIPDELVARVNAILKADSARASTDG
jgi:DNA-binding response OmpR family regulator